MNIVFNRYLIFHPLTWYVVGYLIWMFIPPFFTPKGHHIEALTADFIGIPFLFVGYLLGSVIKNAAVGKRTMVFDERSLFYVLLCFMAIIYYVRAKLYSEVGIYAFLHAFSRESSLLDTIGQQLTTPFIVLIMTMYYRTKDARYLYLLLLEVVMFLIPSMARSYYIIFPMYFAMIVYYYGRYRVSAIIRKTTPYIFVAFVFVTVFGPYINDVRSYAAIGDYEKGLALDLRFEENKSSFIVNRLNVHGEAFAFEPVINEAVRIDSLAFYSMFARWSGMLEDYIIHPTAVSNEVGLLIDYGIKTSTDVPRNYILISYDYGVLYLALFNLAIGALLAFTYRVIFCPDNGLFFVLWIPFVFTPAFGSNGAFPSTFVFQYVFLISSFGLLFVVYLFLKKIIAPGLVSLRRLIVSSAKQVT